MSQPRGTCDPFYPLGRDSDFVKPVELPQALPSADSWRHSEHWPSPKDTTGLRPKRYVLQLTNWVAP